MGDKNNKLSHLKAKTLLILFLVSVPIGALLNIAPRASALNLAGNSSPTTSDRVTSWVYYQAMTQCIGSSSISQNADDLKAGRWFNNNGNAPAAYYLRDQLSGVGSDGKEDCNQANNELSTKALSFWGISSLNFLCSISGVSRDNNQSCLSGRGDFKEINQTRLQYEFQAYIKNTVYKNDNMYSASPASGRSLDGLSSDELYYFYNTTLLQSCVKGDASSITALDTNPGGANVYPVKSLKIANGLSTPFTQYYIGQKSVDDSIDAYPSVTTSKIGSNTTNADNLGNYTLTCKQVLDRGNASAQSAADAINQAAQTAACVAKGYTAGALIACYLGASNQNQPATWCEGQSYNTITTGESKTTLIDACKAGLGLTVAAIGQQQICSNGVGAACDNKNTTSCVIEGIGWFVCATMNAISGVVDGLYGFISSILTLNPLQQNDASGVPSAQYTTWQSIRNIANALLVIAFLFIIFSQVTSFGVSNYGIKKMLPRIIIVAIAINLSYFVMGLAIDITNLLGTGIKTILDTTAADPTLKSVGFANVTQAYLSGSIAAFSALGIGTVAIGVGSASASTLALLLLPFLLGAFLSVLAAFATMFIRNALVIVLVIISPIAFAAYLLPNTQGLFDRWRKLFISMLALFPLAALLFGGARLAAYITISSKSEFSVVIALFIMAAPLGALPFLIKSSNSLLSGINNKLQSAAKSARTASQRGLKPFVDKQRAQYRAGERNFMGRRSRPGSGRNLAQSFDQRRRSRALETQNSESNAEENWKSAGVAGTGGAGQRAQRALDTQKTLGTRKSANEAQIEERSKRRIAQDGTVDSIYERQSFDAQKGSSTAEALTKQRNLGRVRDNAISTSAAAGGERLGNIDRQHFGSEEASKTLDLQIKRANMESGVAAGSVQAQKTAELGIKAVDAEEQTEFDEGVRTHFDTSASAQRIDAATRLSGAATAENKQVLDGQADNTLNLRQADQRKQNAEFVSASIAGNNKTALAQEQQVGGSLFDATMNNAANSKQQDALGKQSDQLIAEATTNSAEPHLNVVDSAARAAMQNADKNIRIATSATEAAGRVATNEHSLDLMSNTSTTAADSGGIDQYGASRVRAAATAQIREARTKAVAAEFELFQNRAVDDNLTSRAFVETIATGNLPGTTDRANDEQIQAAIQYVFQRGTVEQQMQTLDILEGGQFHDYVPSAANATGGTVGAVTTTRPPAVSGQVLQALGQYVGASKLQSVGGAARAELQAGRGIAGYTTHAVATVLGGRVKKEIFAGIDFDELQAYSRIASTGGFGNPADLAAQPALNGLREAINGALSDKDINTHFGPRENALFQNILSHI